MKNGIIKNIRFASFYIGLNLKELYNVIYILIDDIWYHLTIADGKVTFYSIEEPKLISVWEFNDEFKYPIRNFKEQNGEVNKILGKKIIGIKLLYYKSEYEDYTIGIKFYLEDNHFFIISENINENIEILIDEELIRKDLLEKEINGTS